jgi:hypothetical protein
MKNICVILGNQLFDPFTTKGSMYPLVYQLKKKLVISP